MKTFKQRIKENLMLIVILYPLAIILFILNTPAKVGAPFIVIAAGIAFILFFAKIVRGF